MSAIVMEHARVRRVRLFATNFDRRVLFSPFVGRCRNAFLWLGLFASLVLTSCSQQNKASSGTFSAIYSQTLATACIECHKPTGMATVNYGVEIDFSTQASAFSTLFAGTVKGATSIGTCSPVRLVSAGDPSNSYLLGTIIQSYASGNFGGVANCTPYAGHYSSLNLSQSQQSDLVEWIRNGALNN